MHQSKWAQLWSCRRVCVHFQARRRALHGVQVGEELETFFPTLLVELLSTAAALYRTSTCRGLKQWDRKRFRRSNCGVP